MATASFPCVDVSLAGNYRGLAGSQSSAFFGFIEALRGLIAVDKGPQMVLLENVPGLLSSRGGEDFVTVVAALAGLGYWVDAFLVDAESFVPQSRPRLFVVGCRPGCIPPGAARQTGDVLCPWSAGLETTPELRRRYSRG